MIEQTRAEWLLEAGRRFGRDPLSWRFVCPRCGHEQTALDFVRLDAEPKRVYTECIGRALPADQARARFEDGPGPCDWAAFGLLGTLGKGRLVLAEDGSSVEVFDFASCREPSPAGEEAGDDRQALVERLRREVAERDAEATTRTSAEQRRSTAQERPGGA